MDELKTQESQGKYGKERGYNNEWGGKYGDGIQVKGKHEKWRNILGRKKEKEKKNTGQL